MIDYIEASSIIIKFKQCYNTWISTNLTTSIEYKFNEDDDWKLYSKNIVFNYKPTDEFIIISSPTGKIYLRNFNSTGWIEDEEIIIKDIKENIINPDTPDTPSNPDTPNNPNNQINYNEFNEYFTIEATEDNTNVSFLTNAAINVIEPTSDFFCWIYYKINDGEFNFIHIRSFDETDDGMYYITHICTLNKGDKCYLKNNIKNGISSNPYPEGGYFLADGIGYYEGRHLYVDKKSYIYGNINSLITEDFININHKVPASIFVELFAVISIPANNNLMNNISIKPNKKLIFPSKYINDNSPNSGPGKFSYRDIFENCKYITKEHIDNGDIIFPEIIKNTESLWNNIYSNFYLALGIKNN